MGLARLLVLERLPKSSDRESYIEQRRRERGRPAPRSNRWKQSGNIKDDWVDEIPDWEEGEEISDYHTFVSLWNLHAHIRRLIPEQDDSLRPQIQSSKSREACLYEGPLA